MKIRIIWLFCGNSK